MEIHHNPMPKFEVVPNPLKVIREVGTRALDFLFDRKPTPLCQSDHYRGEPSTRGAEAMLATTEPTPVQGTLEFEPYDSEGSYIYIDRSRV